MEIFSAEFLSALAAIVVIDLVLAGDNAIVIALAARNVPKHLQRRVILWGTAGAIVVRTTMTLLMVYLLKVPGLLFAGGAVLVWIAYKLLLPEEGGEHGPQASAASSFWGAIRTIIFADIVMGLDNVLAVAGAAHGSFLLVVLGLLISIPIVIWGSTVIMKFVERYPAIVYVGAGVLAWTAVKMMTGEPLLRGFFEENDLVAPLLYVAVVGGVLWAGMVRNHRVVESRISDHLARLAKRNAAAPQVVAGARPVRLLVPVDGTENSLLAVKHAIDKLQRGQATGVHLLNVQPPFSRHVSLFSGSRNREAYHRDQADKALQPARRLLEQAGIGHTAGFEVGDKAQTIAAEAQRLRCDCIVMATARRKSLTRMLQDSVTHDVLELTTVPVEVIAGNAVAGWERYGVPAGIAAVLALVLVAAEL